jgi:hypothetical protein
MDVLPVLTDVEAFERAAAELAERRRRLRGGA